MSSSPPVPSAIAAAILAATLAACTSAPITPRAELLGMGALPGAATCTVALTSQTASVKVVGGDVVRFVSARGEFGWAFNAGPTVAVFPLNAVAPPGSLERGVLVYVEPDPRYHIKTDFNDNGR